MFTIQYFLHGTRFKGVRCWHLLRLYRSNRPHCDFKKQSDGSFSSCTCVVPTLISSLNYSFHFSCRETTSLFRGFFPMARSPFTFPKIFVQWPLPHKVDVSRIFWIILIHTVNVSHTVRPSGVGLENNGSVQKSDSIRYNE